MITTESKASPADEEELYATYGIMGGYNQPQAHVQVYLNMILFQMDPQEALDASRISLFAHPGHKKLSDRGEGADGPSSNDITCVGVEDDLDPEVVEGLRKLGHHVQVYSGNCRKKFGRGQVIRKESKDGDSVLVYSGGSDPRGDGASVPFL
ncbi:unnamed protein product [Ambrosiozyma monospora]|uniref:Unnamed protein product n=1 Tax=Ambrosiozyma monospora TaxID=43982 RepID=A0A9W6T361_AMBMO|nr:unnamed protein product [Ambrosiozyma monospora]